MSGSDWTDRLENKAKKVAGNQGKTDSQNPAMITSQLTRTLLPDSSHGHPLPPQDNDGIAMGSIYPMLSTAFSLLVVLWGDRGWPGGYCLLSFSLQGSGTVSIWLSGCSSRKCGFHQDRGSFPKYVSLSSSPCPLPQGRSDC